MRWCDRDETISLSDVEIIAIRLLTHGKQPPALTEQLFAGLAEKKLIKSVPCDNGVIWVPTANAFKVLSHLPPKE